MVKTSGGLERVKGVEPSTSTLAISRYLHYRATLQHYVTNIRGRIHYGCARLYLVSAAIASFILRRNSHERVMP